MKSMHFVVGSFTWAALALGILGAAPAPKENRNDLKQFEGAWNFTAWEQGGQTFDNARETARWSVKGDQYTLQQGTATEEGTIKLDSTRKPQTIDLTITGGTDKGKSQVGIYKIDGNTITMCFARPGETDRPKEFKTTEENGHILVTIARKKEK